MKFQRQIFKNAFLLLLVVFFSGSLAFGQYTAEQIAGGLSEPRLPDFQTPAHVDDAYNVGVPGPVAVAPNGDMAWADYWDGNLMYWNSENDELELLIPRGNAMEGIGGSIDDATNGNRISGITFDDNNNIYYTNSNYVLKVDMTDRTLHHVAGNGDAGTPDFSLDAENINIGAFGIVFNHDYSKLYINLLGANMVASMDMATGEMNRVVGTGDQVDGTPEGLALESDIRQPFGIDYVKDPETDDEWIYISSQQKMVYGVNLNTGILYPIAGTGAWNQSGDGGLATEATLLQPHDIAVDSQNRYVYFGDHQGGHHGIRRVDLNSGIIDRYTGIQGSPDLEEWLEDAADDPANRVGHRLEIPTGRAVGTALDNDDNLILGTRSSLLFKVDVETDEMELIAGYPTPPPPPEGPGTPGLQATDMAIQAWGVVTKDGKPHFFDILSRKIVTLEDDGTTTVLAGNGESEFAFTDGVTSVSLDDAQFSAIRYMILDDDGNIIASDFGHHTVYKIDLTNDEVTVVAGVGSSGYDPDHEGGPATEASLNWPHGIRFNNDKSELYITDFNNRRVRVVDMSDGTINTFAGTGSNGETNDPTPLLEANIQAPRDVIVDDQDMVYVATSQHKKIYKLDPVADEVTVLTPKAFRQPFAMTLDENTVWVQDELTIKTVDLTTGEVYTVNDEISAGWAIAKDGNTVYATARDNGLYMLNVETPSTLATIQGYADDNDASELTLDMLDELGANTIEFNLEAYQDAVEAETSTTLPTVESVQKLVMEVNADQADAVLAAIDGFAQADDASDLELFHLAILEINNVVDANLPFYQAVIEAADEVADQDALQDLINTGNANYALSLIDDMADTNDAADLTFTLMRDAGADGANIRQNTLFDYLPFYKDGVEAASAVPDTAALNAIIIAANQTAEDAEVTDALAAINDMAVDNDASDLTFSLMIFAGANQDLFNLGFLEYYKEGVEDASGVATSDELNDIISAANDAGIAAEADNALAMINQMALDSDASELTRYMLEAAGAVNLKSDVPHFEAYQAGIEAATGVADLDALQAIIDQANLELAILKIVAFAEADDASDMTGEDLVEAGVDPSLIIATNIDAYQQAVADADGEDVDTTEKIEALVVAANETVLQDAIAAIIEMADNGDAEDLTALLLTQAGMDFEEDYLEAYQEAIETSGGLEDAEAIQELLTFTTTCEIVKAMAGSETALDLTMEMLDILGIVNVFEIIFDEGYYQDAIFLTETIDDCASSLQDIIDATNFAYIQEMAEFEYSEELTVEMLEAVGVVDVNPDLLDEYKLAVEEAGTIDDLAALQALIDQVNANNATTLTLNVRMSVWADLEQFDPENDYVDVAGDFNEWGDNELRLTPVDPIDDEMTYTVTIDDIEPGDYEFKFRINGSWDSDSSEFPDGGDNRLVTVETGDNTFTYWFNDDEPTNISDAEISGLVLYPNPVNETLNIVSDVTINEIRMINNLGQVVHFERVENDNIRIPVEQFDRGIYLVQILTSEGTSVQRVMINK